MTFFCLSECYYYLSCLKSSSAADPSVDLRVFSIHAASAAIQSHGCCAAEAIQASEAVVLVAFVGLGFAAETNCLDHAREEMVHPEEALAKSEREKKENKNLRHLFA